MRGASGADFITAFVTGVEVECRVARAVHPAHYDAGWHITGTAGIFGAAAACARLLGLDETRCAWALGIAATQSAGIREMFGSMCKSLHVGRAAQGGLTAALLAQQGFTSADAAIEGKRGFINVLSTFAHTEALTAGLTTEWELLRNTYKPYACGLVIHPALDGCIQLRSLHKLTASDITRIEMQVHPLALELTGKQSPSSGLEGKFSVYHAAAIAIIDGNGGEQQFSDARVRSSDAIALRGKVTASVGAGLGMEQAVVTIYTTGGQRHEVRIEHCAGSLERPLSDSELDAKCLGLAEPASTGGPPQTATSGQLRGRCRSLRRCRPRY
jgi:2-methylcitrate dehydratase PrpD